MLTHDEHAPLAIPPGVYEVRRQRIYEPQSPAESRWVKTERHKNPALAPASNSEGMLYNTNIPNIFASRSDAARS